MVRSIECCVLCGAHGVEAAHRDEGKGMGLKTADCATAAICPTCHQEAGNGNKLSREERRAMMDRAIVLTLIEVIYAFGADHDVRWSDPALKVFEEYRK